MAFGWPISECQRLLREYETLYVGHVYTCGEICHIWRWLHMLGMPAMIQPVNEKVQEAGHRVTSRGAVEIVTGICCLNNPWSIYWRWGYPIGYYRPLTRRQITCALGIKSAADTNKWPRIQTRIFSVKSYRASHSNNVVENALGFMPERLLL